MMQDTSKKKMKRVITRKITLRLQCVMTSFYKTLTTNLLISFEALVSCPTPQNLFMRLVHNFLTFSTSGVTKQIVPRKISLWGVL